MSVLPVDVAVDTEPAPAVSFGVAVDAKVLRSALTTIKPAIPGNGNLGILRGVLLKAANQTLTLTACNLDVSVSIVVEAAVYTPGTCLVTFADLVRLSKGKGTVEIVVTDNEPAISQDGFRSTVPPLPLEDYPLTFVAPLTGFTEQVIFNLDHLAELVEATSSDNARPILTGVFFNGRDLVATDSYRLHLVRLAEDSVGITTPTKPLLVARDLLVQLAKIGGTAMLRITEGEVHEFQVGDVTWHFRTIPGEFPNYNGLIPELTGRKEIKFGQAEFMAAVKGVSARQSKNPSVPLRIEPGSPLKMAMIDKDVCTTEASVTGYNELNVTAAFNPAFLLAMLTGIETDTLLVTDQLKPAMAHQVCDGFERIRLIMPVRIAG